MHAPLDAYFARAHPTPKQPQQLPASRGHGAIAHAKTAIEVASGVHSLWKLGQAVMPLARALL